MKKKKLIQLFEAAIKKQSPYVCVEVEVSGMPNTKLVVHRYESIKHELSYYEDRYDDDLVLKDSAGSVRIKNVSHGDSLDGILFMLRPGKERTAWKKLISKAIDNVIEKELKNYPDASEEELANTRLMAEGVKQSFMENVYSPEQEQFIIDNIKEYEELFECAMNGSNVEFKRKFTELSKRLAEA